jgi:GH24 family phage-related lysozyme (muramidase)
MSDQMTPAEFEAEVELRIGINEGDSLVMYHDSLGIPTIGHGWNLQRDDTPRALAACGVTDIAGVIAGRTPLTQAQDDKLFAIALGPVESQARASLDPGVFDALSDARRFVLIDLEYNLGTRGWLGFGTTRAIINEAQAAKNAGRDAQASALFAAAAAHLAASAWDGQVGARAKRDEAMMRTSLWVDPNGNGEP